jgi:hypothetical protein
MKLTLLVLSFSLLASAAEYVDPEMEAYFSDENKSQMISYLQKKLIKGCESPRQEMGALGDVELKYRVDSLKSLLEGRFSQSFAENPKIKEALLKDLDAIQKDPQCLQDGNDCRTRLVATSIYYYQHLRPDISGCKDYVSKANTQKGFDSLCEIEIKYRKENLSYYGKSNGGMDAKGTYTDQLVSEMNSITDKIQKDVLYVTLAPPTKKKPEVKDMTRLYICEPGSMYVYNHKINLYNQPIADLEPGKITVPVEKEKPAPCVEEKMILYSEFVPLNFDEGRSTVGAEQLDPVKAKILKFMTSNPNMVITDISVVSSSSKTPFHKLVGGKKMIDPESNQKNLALAQERANFAQKALDEIKASRAELAKVKCETKPVLAGPDFVPTDLNNRFVTKMTPDYENKVKKMYEEFKDILNKDALIKSPEELLVEERFSNLYQVKYKPYQGFRINISGYKKESMKCGELGGTAKKDQSKNTKAIEQ